jgi:hypothetical protein
MLLASLAALAVVSPAHAATMEVALQDDPVIVRGVTTVRGVASRPLALRQFKAMGGTHIRMTIEHTRSVKTQRNVTARKVIHGLKMYDSAIDAVRAEGLKVQVTLLWRTQSSRRLALWMGNLAKHFGKRVMRYSVFNEPDLLIDRSCGRQSLAFFMRKFPRRIAFPKGQLPRAKVMTPLKTMNLETACLRYKRGLLYRHFVHDASDRIHRANPKAQVLAGETSAQPGLEWFVLGAQPSKMHIAGWAHHPFQLHDLTPGKPANGWGLGNMKLIKRIIKVPLYFTEFGYPTPKSSMDKRAFGRRLKPAEVAKAYLRAWTIARKSGARQMLQYQWYRKPKWAVGYWETALLNRPDGRTTPAYRALRKLLKPKKPAPGDGDYTATTAKACSSPEYPGAGYFTSLSVRRVSCATGRKVELAHYRCRTKHGALGRCAKKVRGYRCTEKRESIPTETNSRVKCIDGRKRVTYTYQQNT